MSEITDRPYDLGRIPHKVRELDSEYARMSEDSEGYANADKVREALRLAHEALNAVEWMQIHAGRIVLGYRCVWCGMDKRMGHSSDCLRARALDAIAEVSI